MVFIYIYSNFLWAVGFTKRPARYSNYVFRGIIFVLIHLRFETVPKMLGAGGTKAGWVKILYFEEKTEFVIEKTFQALYILPLIIAG